MEDDEIRTTLHNEEQRLAALRDDLRSSDDLDAAENGTGELAGVDNHPADLATDQQNREQDLSMIEQIEAEITAVEDALAKLDNGKYGICEVGGEQIEKERLEALPATRYCAEHAGAAAGGQTSQVSPI